MGPAESARMDTQDQPVNRVRDAFENRGGDGARS